MNKKNLKPLISKETFLEICDLIKKQKIKDNKFINFLESYFIDSYIIPNSNNDLLLAINKLMNEIFYDTKENKDGYTWWTWFVYEDEFGENKFKVTLDRKEYIISSPDKFYDFMLEWLKSEKKELN